MDSTTDVNTGAPETTAAPAVPAESSPAADSTPTTFIVPTDPKAYQEWRQKGTLPGPPKQAKAQPKTTEESATSDESASDEGGEKTEPASEPGTQKQEQQPPQPRKNAADRLNELLGDLKRAGLTPHELKTYKREAQAAATPPQTKAAPETTAQPSAQAAAEPPKLEDFTDWGELHKAERAYMKAELLEEVRRELQQQEVQRQAEARLAEAKTRYGDEAETYIRSTATAVFNDQTIPPPVKILLNESDVCADVLYAIGSDAKEFESFLDLARTNPGKAIRKIVLIEQLVQDELKKPAGVSANGNGTPPSGANVERDESGKFVKTAPASTKVAPPPAREVSGKASAPPDALARAIADNDMGRYRELMNKRDFAARRGN